MDQIASFFSPKSIAILGLSDREGSVPRIILDHALEGKEQRKVYAVGNKERVYDLPLYTKLSDMPEPVELAVIVLRAEAVPDAMLDCAKAGVKATVIISAGFKEVGDEGRKREELVLETARQHGIRILGPNCLGVIRPSSRLNSTFYGKIPKPGNITFLSQSGALGTAVLDWAISKDIGFSAFASLGSMADVDFGDLIDYFGNDPETKSIIIYMESIGATLSNARKFVSAARGFARNKPIIILKPGEFAESNKAAMSHTGSMVGEDSYYDAVFDRAGVVRVKEIAELFDCATILNTASLPKDPRIAIVTNAGGPGVLATDAILRREGILATISQETIAELNKVLPPTWSKGNPIDIIGDATPQRFAVTLEKTFRDPNIGGITVIYVPTSTTSPMSLARELVKIAPTTSKPLVSVLMGGDEAAQAKQLLLDNRLPAYEFPEDAIKTYQYMYKYAHNLQMLYETPEDWPVDTAAPKNYLKMMVYNAIRENGLVLTEEDSKKLITAYRIRATVPLLARSAAEATSLASDMGLPVAMKIASKEISHKSDVGGVMLNLRTQDAVNKAFTEMVGRVKKAVPSATIDGVTLQPMVLGADYELIVGAKKDPTLGPVILFGLGGTSAEFFRDVSVGLPPLNQVLARRIIQKAKVYSMLAKGFRNHPPADLLKIDEVLIRVSEMIIDFPEIKELDINPLVVTRDSVIALDARVVLDPTVRPDIESKEHLIVSPYPTRYVEQWRTEDDRAMIIRPIRPEDESLERQLIAGLSKDAQRYRFFQPIKDITHEMLTRFCNIDYEREMAFVAEYEENGKRRFVGAARLILGPDLFQGEFAVVVADDFQGVGLGLKLSDKLIGFAHDKGVRRIYATALSDNARMLNLGRKLSFAIKDHHNGEMELSLELAH